MMKMKKYKTNEILVDAFRLVHSVELSYKEKGHPWGTLQGKPGDWMVIDAFGERIVSKDHFEFFYTELESDE